MYRMIFISLCLSVFIGCATEESNVHDYTIHSIKDDSGDCRIEVNAYEMSERQGTPITEIYYTCASSGNAVIWRGVGADYEVKLDWVDSDTLKITHPKNTKVLHQMPSKGDKKIIYDPVWVDRPIEDKTWILRDSEWPKLKDSCEFADANTSRYFVFVGEKVSLDFVPPKEGKVSFDAQFKANYKILKPLKGNYGCDEITFTVYDHYGLPPFSRYDHVLLYLVAINGRYYHSKYQFQPVYKTTDGRWAGAYAAYDYNHSYNQTTPIKPEKIDFFEEVFIDVSKFDEEYLKKNFPKPYYEIRDGQARAVYGNYIEELFLLKQSGVLKAREDFQ